MIAVTDLNQLSTLMADVRRAGRGLVTNFYPGREQLASWIASGSVTCMRTGGSLLILRRDRDFRHLYYLASDHESLRTGLTAQEQVLSGQTFVSTVVGTPKDIESICELLRTCGFFEDTFLLRMSRRNEPSTSSIVPRPGTDPARPEQADAILALLERHFERFSKQLPELDEVKEAIAASNILIARNDKALQGMLWFETRGISSQLRYWCVDEKHRGEGVGSALLTEFLDRCRASKNLFLWVKDCNATAIRQYRKYGFQEEGTIARIFVRRVAAAANERESRSGVSCESACGE